MITLRCTRRAAKALGFDLLDSAPPGTSPLGDWYVNLIPTVAGGVYLFVNEQSLLAVVVPRGEPDLLRQFVARVGNILSMIGVSNQRIEEEVEHFRDARVARTASRKILGVMNEIAFQCQMVLEDATPENKVSISDLELDLAQMPHATLAYGTPCEVALELLDSSARYGVS
ncbi:MAG TPA: hypothetical protein VM534_03820 [Thermoanaerobaculia bacterium]|nr:hypothetical protein [Thermoanaerobaculia bacterium]